MVTRTLLIVTFILPFPVLFTLVLGVLVLCVTNYMVDRSQWPRGLGLRSAASRLLRFLVRIPPGAWMSVLG